MCVLGLTGNSKALVFSFNSQLLVVVSGSWVFAVSVGRGGRVGGASDGAGRSGSQHHRRWGRCVSVSVSV